ncbi:MAG: MBG domain-containing protein [Pirellulales bacterium]
MQNLLNGFSWHRDIGDFLFSMIRRVKRQKRSFVASNCRLTRAYISKLIPCVEPLEQRALLATLGLGDIAFTGYQATTTDKVSFVLLKAIDSGTVLTVTDNAWNGTALNNTEGNSVITISGSFTAGTQFNFDASRTAGSRWAVGSTATNIADVTGGNFGLAAAGDNLFAYNGSTAPTSGSSSLWVAAFATNAFLPTGGTATANLTLLPTIFASTNSQLSLGLANGANNENGVYSGGNVTGTVDQIRTAVHNVTNWTTFTTAGAQVIPPSAVFTVQTGNNPPTSLSLSNSTIQENAGINATVGVFTTVDPDVGDVFSYSLVTGSGSTNNSSFNISGSTLRATTSLSSSNLSVRVRSSDQGSLSIEAVFAIQVIVSANSTTLKIVSYNIASADAPGTPRTGLDTILAAIGSEAVSNFAKPIDLLALQEVFSQSSTTQTVANQMNAIYGSGIYGRGSLNGASIGSGTQGVVYNTQTLQLLGEAVIGSATSGSQPRQTMRYHFRPRSGGTGNDFYLYNSHWKANDDQPSEDQRLIEAQLIRNDADSLGNGVNIIYVGDYNTYRGSDLGFQEMLSTGAGQAKDPVNRVGAWSGTASFNDIFTQAPAVSPPSGLTGGGLDDRFDFQLNTAELSDGQGLEYRSGSYHTFGNNGSVPVNGDINSSSSTALSGLSNRLTVLNLLTTVSDHLPVVADYTIPANPTVTVTSGSAVYNGTTYTATASVTGFGLPDPSGSLSYTYYADANGTQVIAAPTNAGTYFVRAATTANSGNNAAQSAITQFVISPASLTATATASNKIYDGLTDATVAIALGGVISGDTVTGSATGTFDTKNVGTGKTVTVGTVTLGGIDAGNYTVGSAGTTTANISAKGLTVVADSVFKSVGQSDPAFTFSATGFANNETIASALTGALTRDTGESVGVYTIRQGTLTALNGNYTISFTTGTLSILSPIAVSSYSVNAGAAQRSMLTSISLTFNTPVTLTAGAFSITNIGLTDRSEHSAFTVTDYCDACVGTPSTTFTITFALVRVFKLRASGELSTRWQL